MVDIEQVINSVPMGNKLRNERVFEIVASLMTGAVAGRTEDPVPGRSTPWAHAMGAFRFFDNEAVQVPALYDMCRKAIRECLPDFERAYVVHDPSLLDYSLHNAKEDRVEIGDHRGRGYELFTALVLDSFGRPVGPVFQEIRTSRGCIGSESTEPVPFVGNIEQMEAAIEAADKHLPVREVVNVADREFDDLALQRGACAKGRLYVIRVQHLKRSVLWGGKRAPLNEVLSSVKLQHTGDVEHSGKTYERWVGETKVVLDGVSWRGRHRGATPVRGEPIEVRLVVGQLRRDGSTETTWALFTNLADLADKVVQIYVWRWRIERFFYLTKIGFRLEQWTQQSGGRIARRLAVSMLAAIVIYQMLDATNDPEMIDAVEVVATMGGWLGRKRDPIGPIVLMRGVMQLMNALFVLQKYDPAQLRAIAERLGIAFLLKR